MRVTFLGTAAAEGIPQLWCRCDGCRIARERGGRHIRRRTATLINDDLLIDAGPDVAFAAAHIGLDLAPVRAILLTHPHYDHLSFGTLRDRGRHWGGTPLPPLTVYGGRASLELLAGWADPKALHFETRRIAPFEQFTVATGGASVADPRLPVAAPFPEAPARRYEIHAFMAAHAEPEDEAMLFAVRQVDGPEVADGAAPATLLYATDTGPFPEATWAALDRLGARGIRFGAAVVDATFGNARDLADPRPHMTIAQMIGVQRELARRGLLAENSRRLAIHFSHSLAPPHDELVALLAPERIAPAYDGLTLTNLRLRQGDPAGGTAMSEDLRGRIVSAIDEHAPGIIDVADQIHRRPELGFEERFASHLLAERLRASGFEVEKPVGGLETAFRATKRGKGPGPTIAVLAEYDALPAIGHGCGHNLIGASGLGAAIGLGQVMDQLDGTFQIIGTPAEEGGGGKIVLIEAGIFEGVDASLMIHHAGPYTGSSTEYPGGTCLAVSHYKFTYHGKPAHAAGDPYNGANALNGVIKLFTGIDAIRQHVRTDARIHGIISHGGDAPNVVPHLAEARFYIRAGDRAYLEVLEQKVMQIAEGAALMTETRVEITKEGPTCYDMRPSFVLGRRYESNMREVGMVVDQGPRAKERGPYSTDFGNVSYLMPAATGSFAISHEQIPGHSQQVVDASASPFGYDQLIKVSTAMTLTAFDLFVEPDLLREAKDEHTRWVELYERG